MKDINKTEGIVIKCKDFTESSQLVWMYTKDFGKIKVIAKGSRKRSDRFKSKLDLINRIELVYYHSRKSELHSLSESEVLDSYNEIRADLGRMALSSYIFELLDSITPLEDPCPEVYSLLAGTLDWLKVSGDVWLIKAVLEIKLLQFTGHFKGADNAGEGTKAIVKKIVETDNINSLRVLRASPAQKEELNKMLTLLIDYFINKRLKSLSFLKEVCCGETG